MILLNSFNELILGAEVGTWRLAPDRLNGLELEFSYAIEALVLIHAYLAFSLVRLDGLFLVSSKYFEDRHLEVEL